MLMTIDHSGTVFDAAHLHGDNFRMWLPGSPLPAGEFLTRWITHLCAPTFVLLAGVSLALSTEKRRNDPTQTRFIVTRGLLIAALDPLWMSLGFAQYHVIVHQVLYAIGMSMACMAFLRRLPTRVLLVLAFALQGFGELARYWTPTSQPAHALWTFLWSGGIAFGRVRVSYPLFPWLSIMMFGWAFGRWLITPRSALERVRFALIVGFSLLAMFALLRGIDGYGNWGLHRDSADILQWLHVNKYPPSITYTALELGISFLLLAGFLALDNPAHERRAFAPFALFGATAFFYYLLHVHVMVLAQYVLQLDMHSHGLAKTWLAAALVLCLLAGPTWLFRRYKRAHPDGWTRYI